MRIGLIQTRGMGDIVIALPIAQYFLDAGHEVEWPIDSRWVPFFQAAAPGVSFHGVDAEATGPTSFDYFYGKPMELLRSRACDQFVSLYSYMSDLPIVNQRLAASMKFDEYKYAAAGVPFSRKWTLRIQRNRAREEALFQTLGVTGPYALVHEHGSSHSASFELPPELANIQRIDLSERTDNPFDWLMAIERAALLVMIDSFYANLVEGLNLPNHKVLILRSPITATPVFKNGWIFR